jgi:hypothetical protein
LRIKGLEGYEPPSEQIAGMFEEEDEPDSGSEERRLHVIRFMKATGGA